MKQTLQNNRAVTLGHLVLLLLIFTLKSNAQSIRADSLKFPIGKQINLTIELNTEKNDKVTWPVFNDTITKSIEVLSRGKIDTIQEEGSSNKLYKQVIQITSFDTGYIVLPPVKFLVSRNNRPIESLETEPLMFEVFKLKVDPQADIKDIKPIIKAPITFAELLPWIALVIVISAIAYGLYYYFKKRQTTPVEKPQPKIKIPAWEIALQQLQVLKNEALWQKGEIKDYYTKLTDILRDYFESRYGVNATEMTSSEIIEAIQPHIKDENAMKSLNSMLSLSDMAKFAKAQPGAYENEQSILYGIEIVKYTIPKNHESVKIKNESEVNSERIVK